MYSLFEVRKVLSLCNPGGEKGVRISLTAYSEMKEHSILVLVCTNGYLLFRYTCVSISTPVVRQLCWFSCPEKQIKALSFDSSGTWLLIVTQDATIYILPVFSLLEDDAKMSSCWKVDNLTEIRLTGKRAPLTSVQWWQTHEGQHIAIIGSELGEISFINLVNKQEVGGTYITAGISSLDILYDESHDTTYLLITGSNQQQWRLLLEERKSNVYWPFNSDTDIYNSGKATSVEEKASLTDERGGEQRPHRLSKFESGTFLTPQCGDGQNLVSAYNSSSCLLQVLEGDLDQMHLFSYKVPPDCESIILSDKMIFTTSKGQCSSSEQQYFLRIIARKFSEISTENSKKKEAQASEVQKFAFNDEILALYKLAVPHTKSYSKIGFSSPMHSLYHSASSAFVKNSLHTFGPSEERKIARNADITESSNLCTSEKQILEGCILVQKDSVWECRLRISPEELFLSLTSTPNDLPLAEKLGIMLGLDLNNLYEFAADIQLSRGQFAQAVHLYQLSKCPQLKRVAHFMGYGFLSELIAYIQVLFSTKGVEIVSPDKCHFANIALLCFTHQAKDKVHERNAIIVAFKKFLKENSFYDEEVAAKLLAEQGLYELLYYFSKVRAQQGLMVETLFSTGGIRSTIDDVTHDVLLSSGYEMILQHSNDDHYMKCMTSYHLLQFLAAKPSFLSDHLQHLITLLPRMDVNFLRRVAFLYDPSREAAKLVFRNMTSSKTGKRYWSLSSLGNVPSEILDVNNKVEELATGEDIIKFFIFVLLMICHKLGYPKFCKELVEEEILLSNGIEYSCKFHKNRKDLDLVLNQSPVSCGQAHAAYIHNGLLYTWGKSSCGRLGTDLGVDFQPPQPVPTLLRLQINVLAVSCGALHSLALTDCGVFGWGSSRFGQLGVGDVQQAIQPILVESLLIEEVLKVHCGQYHSLALTADGRVYTWGWGIHGQLGHGNAEDINLPKVIQSLKKKKIISVAAGQGHSVLLSKNGDVYAFGCGMFGQLGSGSVLKQSYPQLVKIPERIKLIASGHFHVLAVSRINKLYTWGCNPQALRLQAQNSRRARQHGSSMNQNLRSPNTMPSSYVGSSLLQRSSHFNGTVQQSHLLPSLVNAPTITDTIVEVSCGSHHSVVLTSDGMVFSWGRNSEGQVGNGSRKEQKIPSITTHLKDKNIVHVSCGADFTVVVDTSGKVYGWGQNDGGQIGQRPSPESSSKSNSGSSSGRVITIRTNRRMITITQPCRQSILRPVEIIIPVREREFGDLDSGSFENEYSVLKLINHATASKSVMQDIPKLSKLDDPPYGPIAVHAALKVFHHVCDSNTLLSHCLNFGNFQAAAKLCALESLYDQALKYQLKSILLHSNKNISLQTALYVIKFYTSMIDQENIDASQMFLSHIIKFWMENKLSVPALEIFFKEHLHIFSYPLSLITFSDKSSVLDSHIRDSFLKLLSAQLSLNNIYGILKDVERGCNFAKFIDEIMIKSGTSNILNQIYASDAATAWDDSVPSERLWLDILHNMQTGVSMHSAILLSANDVDGLAKSFLNDNIYLQSFNNMPSSKMILTGNGNDAIVFSCGHHHIISTFQTSILPLFKDSMSMLSYSLPQTTKLLLSEYHSDVIAAACPKCVVSEIKNDL